MILVAISYGTSDSENGNERGHDYTAPSDELEHYGGAHDFQIFLDDELIPFVEASYRSRIDRRILFGQSLGGQFVLYTAQTRPTLFWGHIASNPALHRNLELFLTMTPDIPPVGSRSYLFVGGGSHDDPRFREPRSKWIEHWMAEEPKPWHLKVETLDNHTHFSAPPAAFRRGLKWLFADQLEPAQSSR
jgi:predicted alpha/beta superfamily hydrolase